VAGLIGGFVGAAELVARYRDAPAKALRTMAALIYTLINIIASVAALLFVHVFGWTFGATTPDTIRAYQVLVASFGSIALFRTSLFTLKAGDSTVGIGPSVVLASLLDAADRQVDRYRATGRSADVVRLMRNVSFVKAEQALPTYCLALLQNVPDEDQAALRRAVDALAGSSMDDRLKALSLGLQLMNIAGVDVLTAAVNALGDEIKT
jgi:hypothetical protein